MKREDREFELRIAEAVRAAAGKWRRGPAASLAEAATGKRAGGNDPAESLAAALGDLVSRVNVLASPARAAFEGGWRGVLSNLNPILGGLVRLFGGGEAAPAPAPALAAVVRPAARRLDLGYGSGQDGYFHVDRDAGGAVRAGMPVAAPTVVINIDAIDSKSFLERTPEIAEAVKRVILESEGMRDLFGTWRE